MIRRSLTILAFTPLLMAQQCASTQTVSAPSTRAPQTDIGVVLLHGKSGRPGGRIASLGSRLSSAGFRVVTPEMPWSRSRSFDRDVAAAMAEISTAAAKLRAAGAKRIVIAGHSLGAAAAIAYAARHKVAGIVLLAPGGNVSARGFQFRVDNDWQRAAAMVKAGRGGETASFKDFNLGRRGTVTTTARNYYAWYRPDSAADIRRNLPRVRRGTAVLWVSGSDDPLMATNERLGSHGMVPPNPKNRRATVSADHSGVPRAASSIVIAWLRSL